MKPNLEAREWYELVDCRKRLFANAAWIPVYGVRYPVKAKEYPEIGYCEEVLAIGSAVIFDKNREQAGELDWHFWSQNNSVPFIRDSGIYSDSSAFRGWGDEDIGFRLVQSQYFNNDHPRGVSIHQDLVYAYGLIEEGNVWVRPSTGYESVIRCDRGKDGEIKYVEIRTEYLRDYLAARKASFRLYYYRERKAVLAENPNFKWLEPNVVSDEAHDRCETRCTEIGESGDIAGKTFAVFKSWRNDVDPEEDIPNFHNENDENTESSISRGTTSDRNPRYHITGEMWRGEWIEAADEVSLLGYAEPDEDMFVSADASGRKVNLKELNFEEVGKYLWFSSALISDLLSKRGSFLNWYNCETGSVSPSPDDGIHFGMNSLGLINAYAYDVARLPLWVRKIWVAHNVRPDGKVSAELLQAQMACDPADSNAPEELLINAIEWLDDCFKSIFGKPLFKGHDQLDTIVSKLHRFRATSDDGLKELAKDIVRITVERMDKKVLLSALGDADSKLGSMKLLEAILAKATDSEYAAKRLAPLFGAYDLRSADAHLPSSQIDKAYEHLDIDRDAPSIVQGMDMIGAVANAIGVTGGEIKKHLST